MNMIGQDGALGWYKLIRRYAPSKEPVKVADVMTTGIVTLSPNDTLDVAIEYIVKRDYQHLIVADDTQKVLGIISYGDIVGRGGTFRSGVASEVMAPNPICVTEEIPLFAAISIMISKRLNCLPVVKDSGVLCGVITSTDIMKSYQKMLESTL